MTAEAPPRDLDWEEVAAQTPWTQVPEWLIDSTDLSAYAKTTYVVLARHVNRQSGDCFPGVARLCSLVGCGEDRLRSAMHELQDADVLRIRRRGRGLTNMYRLRFTNPKRTGFAGGLDPDESGVKTPTPRGTNQTEENQTEREQAVDARERARVPDELRRALRAAGFGEQAVIDAEIPLGRLLVELDPVPDTDWWQVGQEIKQAFLSNRLRRATPASAVKFIANGMSGLPRVRTGGPSEPGAELRAKYSDGNA